MLFNITKDISVEIMVIYGLIALTVALIVFIIILDKKEKKKRIMNRTQELRLMDLRKTEENYAKEFKKQPLAMDTELKSVVEVKKEEVQPVCVVSKTIDNSSVTEVVKKPEVISTESIIQTDEYLIDENMYIEDDLEKTSAQLHLEMLAKELEKAQIHEEEKIRRFEAEQEENAIISYNELLKVCEELYDKNEKVQYMDEGNEPINLEELRNRFRKETTADTSIMNQEIELLD